MSQLDFWRKNWDPFKEVSSPRFIEKWMDDFYTPSMRKKMEEVRLTPHVEVIEDRHSYSLKFDLPGVPKEQIKVNLNDNYLTVSGERKEEKREEGSDRRTHVSELYYGSFERGFQFPERVDAEKVEAKFENGVLLLTIPKKESSPKRQIPVQ